MNKRILLFLFIILGLSLFPNTFTSADSPKNYLKGKFYESVKDNFLVATRKMNDNRFKRTVIVMLESNEDGAWGLVINKPLELIPIALLIDPSKSTPEERKKLYKINVPIFWGGPVNESQIFILHSQEYKSETTKDFGSISISQDHKILLDIAKNKGPEKSLIILGYSGWGNGQLEGEMEKDHWILSDIDLNILFQEEHKKKWNKAYKNSFIKI